MVTSKQIVYDTLNRKNADHRTARDLWILPWAQMFHGEELNRILKDYSPDICGIAAYPTQPTLDRGNPYEVGESVDSWGCKFVNLQRGVIGEVKDPLVKDDDWEDADNVHIPEEWLSFRIEQVNEDCKKNADKFTTLGCPRPFEQMQFIRGTENFYCDLLTRPKKMLEFLEKLHDFYCRYFRKLAQTDVDALLYMDDWGSQNALLIDPKLWKEFFRPLYRDYIDIAHAAGKKVFMHSDGYILDILPELIDLGLDAVNCQIFCMGTEKLKPFRGKITFWGEIDRQHLLPYGTKEDIRAAVRSVHDALYDQGGCIAQCEFGIGAKPENVREVFAAWEELR